MFYIVPAFYILIPCLNQPEDSKLKKWRNCKIIYLWLFINKDKILTWKDFQNPLATPNVVRYFIDPRQWSELKYKLYGDKFFMVINITFIAKLKALIIKFFDKLKPCVSLLIMIPSYLSQLSYSWASIFFMKTNFFVDV